MANNIEAKMERFESGFTMVELLMAMALSMVLMLGMTKAFQAQRSAYSAHHTSTAMESNMRAAAYILERNIRMAGFDYTGCVCAGLTTATATQLDFTIDADKNGAVSATPSDNETFSIQTADSDGDGVNDSLYIQSPTGAGVNPIARNIRSVGFTYYDSTGAQLTSVPLSATDLGNVRTVEMTITGAGTAEGKTYTDSLVTRIKLRNIGLNT